MVNILRVKARWSGFSGGPGYTVLHFRDFGTGEGGGSDPDAVQAKAAVDRTRAFFFSMQGLYPDDVRIQVEGVVDMLEDTTGQLVDSFSVAEPAIVAGAGTASYAAAAGAVVNWRTAAIRRGRRIRGRSFIVPLISTAFDTTGKLATSTVTTIQAGATALVDATSSPDLGVYARPTAPGTADGQWAVATSATVPALGALLTSRRD